jgi:hypothetical protein
MKYQTIEAIERHVREDAYFATTATVLDLLRQELASRRGRKRRTSEVLQTTTESLQQMRDGLMYLQENYRIIRRRRKTRP